MESITLPYFGLTQTCKSCTAYEHSFGISFLWCIFSDEWGSVASLLLHGTSQLLLVDSWFVNMSVTSKHVGFFVLPLIIFEITE